MYLVADVTSGMIEDVLRPIWATTHQTASRLRQRIRGLRSTMPTLGKEASHANPARWRGALKNLLPPSKAVRKTRPAGEHWPCPGRKRRYWFEPWRRDGGTVARALLFTLHTAGRTTETLRDGLG